MAKRLEELPVYQEALKLSVAITAILEGSAFARNSKLRDQILSAVDSVLSNMAEGFEQPTDAGLQHFLFISKGSAAEVRTRVQSAQLRRLVGPAEAARCLVLAGTVERMLGGWIKYLARCGWTDRGRHGARARTRTPEKP